MKLFVIPTHRLCIKAVSSMIKEIKLVYEHENDVKLIILDNSKADIFTQNHDYLKKLNKEEKNIHIYHIGLNDMMEIIQLISDNCILSFHELKEMLYPDKIDYGKIGNMIYIVTLLLKERGFHRRDSDCFVFDLKENEYPVKVESKYLGEKVNIIKDIEKQEKLYYTEEERVCIVGGDYTGNWDLDTQKVTKANPEAMKYMMMVCGISEEDINEQFDIKYNEAEKKEKQPILSSVFEVSQSPECGNISMYDVFRYIPNFIGENGIGFDNHTYFMTFLVKTPVIFHFNRISHIHDKNRNKDIIPLNYWKGMAKMVDFDCFHLAFINAGYGEVLCKDGYGLKALKNSYQKEFPDYLENIFNQLQREERINRIEIIANKVLRPANQDAYIKIADYLIAEKEHIVDQLDYDYKLSIKLQRNWVHIVDATEKIASQLNTCIPEV